MSLHIARTALAGMSGQPALLEERYGVGADGPVSLHAHLQQLATARPDQEETAWERRKGEIAAEYGGTGLMTEKPFVFFDGVAVIPIHGLLINRFPYSWGFVTGYSFIRSQLAAAQDDPDVERIVFDVDTYGGMVAGCHETAEMIYASRAKKPSMAVIDAYCYSAGMYLATAASRVVMTPSGGAGSIGVIAMRLDVTKWMEKEGWKVHLVYAGARKVDGQPVAEFTAEAKAQMQASVDRSYGRFTAAVAKYRKIGEDVVRNTEAACYDAEEATALRLVDAVMPASEALLATSIWDDGQTANQENEAMTTKPAANADPQDPAAPANPPAAAPAAAAAAPAAPAVDLAAIRAEAVAAERARSTGILDSDEAKDRPALARHLATNTDMSVDAAKAILKAAAPETKPKAGAVNPLDAAMAATGGTPNVGAGGSEGDAGQPQSAAARILASQAMATGMKPGQKPN